MQRLVLALLLLAVAAGLAALLFGGLRSATRDAQTGEPETRGGIMRKVAFAALFILIAGAALGLLGGL